MTTSRTGGAFGGRKQLVGTRAPITTTASFELARGGIASVKQPPYRGGMATLEVSGVEATAAAELVRASEAAASTFDDEMYPWYQRVIREWPVLTGFSKKAWSIVAEQVGDTLRMRMRNQAPYVLYIRQGGYNVPNAVKRLVWDPSKEVTKRMADRLADWMRD